MITVGTLFSYLIGGKEAIRRVASHPKALWIGLVFVMAAGFAREYDGEDLLRDPWHLALPVVASLVTSFLLYVCLRVGWMPEERKRDGDTFWGGYVVLLRLYWWTAPLALLYAIPFERYMGPAMATRANLSLLGLVALWRVILITRAVSVTWQSKFWRVLFPVLLFADTVALALLFVAPLPTFSLMGGVRLSESESLIRGAADTMIAVCAISLLISLAFMPLVSILLGYAGMGRAAFVVPPNNTGHGVSKSLKIFAALALLIWIPILPFTQPEQQRRRAFEVDLKAGNFKAAMERVKDQPRSAYPPHWDPPPRIGYGEYKPNTLDVLAAAIEHDAPLWVASAYVEKVRDRYLEFKRSTDAPRKRIRDAFPRYTHAKELLRRHKGTLRGILEHTD